MGMKIEEGLKARIIDKMKEEGLTVSQAAKEFEIPKRTIYGWLLPRRGGDGSTLEISRLRRENRELKELIGALSLDTERRKKNS